mmetsp:Transcript_14791/g.34126  ORF Transcript_14791/g.34126 Transcript_14791/m.34126 type:complete len:116 (+) Transcript_14791:193-540(+)
MPRIGMSLRSSVAAILLLIAISAAVTEGHGHRRRYRDKTAKWVNKVEKFAGAMKDGFYDMLSEETTVSLVVAPPLWIMPDPPRRSRIGTATAPGRASCSTTAMSSRQPSSCATRC